MNVMRLFWGSSVVRILILAQLFTATGCALTPATAAAELSRESAQQIVLACTDLVLDYALYRDQLEVENMAALFTDDAQLSIRGQTYVGQQAIRARVQQAAKGPTTRHLMSTIRIKPLSADKATGISYVTVYAAPQAEQQAYQQGELPQVDGFAIIGNYVDVFERTAQGWRIASRRLEGAFRSAASPAQIRPELGRQLP